MLKLGSETGSLINHVYSRCGQPVPEVGMGATILCWSDRHAGTIIKVTPKQIHVQYDIAKNVGTYHDQKYEYTPNPDGRIVIFRMTKRGWKSQSGGLLIGVRDEHFDTEF